LNILDIIHLSNEIDLDYLRTKNTSRCSAPRPEATESDDTELELFAMDDVTVAFRTMSMWEHNYKSTHRKEDTCCENGAGISIPRIKKRGSRRHEIKLDLDDDRVLDELSATERGLKRGWHEERGR
jgi:hypothetical protein